MIKRKGRRRARGRVCRIASAAAGITLAAAALSACSSASAGTGPVTLNFYLYPDTSGATEQAISNCNAQSGGKYTISYQMLPQASDGQRQQLVRRLVAHDPSIDILGLDVTWEAEFAEAGLIVPWTGSQQGAGRGRHAQARAADGHLEGPARRGAGQHQHAAAVVPLGPGAQAADHLGGDDRRRRAARQGGQAALHRDPGRAVRGRHRLVQHDGGERGRQHPERQRHRARHWARPPSRPCRS